VHCAEMRVFSPAKARLYDWMACLSAVRLIDSSTAINSFRRTTFPPIICQSHYNIATSSNLLQTSRSRSTRSTRLECTTCAPHTLTNRFETPSLRAQSAQASPRLTFTTFHCFSRRSPPRYGSTPMQYPPRYTHRPHGEIYDSDLGSLLAYPA
jgi:hypothetical protein